MLYQLGVGQYEDDILKQAAIQGLKPPKQVAEAPQLLLGLEMFLEAFERLNSCRSFGLACGPIPWTAIDHYCQRYRIRGESEEAMLYHIRSMDNAYLEFMSKDKKKGGKS